MVLMGLENVPHTAGRKVTFVEVEGKHANRCLILERFLSNHLKRSCLMYSTFANKAGLRRISGSHSGGYGEFIFWDITSYNPLKFNRTWSSETSVDFKQTTRSYADYSGRAVSGIRRLRPLERWDRGLESHSRHGCLRLYCACVALCR
jgi:hypothetical protein